jgi:dCMP deaminase
MTPPRKVPSWDEFYLGLAYQYAGRSKDPHTQMGAVVVDPFYVPLGFGYNGAPRQIKDDDIDWSRSDGAWTPDCKYPFMKHAEINCLDHCNRFIGVNGLDNCILYVTSYPCSKCMLQVVSRGIQRICFGPLEYASGSPEELKISKHIADKAGVLVEPFNGELNWMKDRAMFVEKLGLIHF